MKQSKIEMTNTSSKKIKNIFWITSIVFLVLLCVFLRVYCIDHTIEFWGDIGRDNEKLMEWYQTGKPPLNGPNTILKIVNQSPWFFYLNYPVFLLGKSPLTMTFTVTVLMVLSYLLGLYILKKKERESIIFSFLFFFISLHPLIVIQQRTPWNPSFSIPFLFLAIATYLSLRMAYSSRVLSIGLFSLCMALGLTYSLFPVIFLFCILFFLATPKNKKLVFIGALCISLFIIFLPNIIFEVKSSFFLLRRLPGGINVPPVSTPIISKAVFAFLIIMFGGTPALVVAKTIFISVIFFTQAFFVIFSPDKKDKQFAFHVALATIASVVTLLMPFQQGYYLFGLILLWFLAVSSMRKLPLILICIACALFWYKPVWEGEATRPIRELDQCAKTFCSQYPGKYYVSANAWHGMHSAHDHTFFINRNGCTARDIISHPEWQTDKMIVVADRLQFIPYKSSYYELEQFGAYEIKGYYNCSPDIQYWYLQKKELSPL